VKIAVAGATGVLGRHVVATARVRGHDLVPMARSLGIDLTTGSGLDEALAGVTAVVDATSTAAQRRARAEAFFSTVTSTLLAAEQSAGVAHHVAVSIIGTDAVDLGYYQGKRRQEELVTGGPVRWSLLRTTQFHEFAEQSLEFIRMGPVSLVPAMPSQTVAASEVASALIDLCEAGPSGRAPDLAGPEQNRIDELAHRIVRHRGDRRAVVALRVPGAAGRAIRSGALRPTTEGPRGRQTFEEWLRTV
jgi:uncharacterized protein YbjT (DUF2867 family)